MSISKSNLSVLKNKIKSLYKTIDKIHCPILDVEVVFNSIGFRHLIYKSDGTPRKSKEVFYKLNLFPLAIPVIKNAISVLDERDIVMRTRRKKSSLKKKAKTFALVARVGRRRTFDVRVIILKVGNGKHIFYSIMKN